MSQTEQGPDRMPVPLRHTPKTIAMVGKDHLTIQEEHNTQAFIRCEAGLVEVRE